MDNGENLKGKIRRVADEFEKYVGSDGKVNASALVDEISRLTAEVTRLQSVMQDKNNALSAAWKELAEYRATVSTEQNRCCHPGEPELRGGMSFCPDCGIEVL